MFKENLEVAKDFKTVNYDGVVYKVEHLIKLKKNEYAIQHICSDGLYKTSKLDWTIELPRKRFYRASFCNKCKTLVLKKVKK